MSTSQSSLIAPEVSIAAPTTADAASMWRIARDSHVLDLNSSYAYLLWCAHFSATSAVAKVDDEVVGYVTGYAPPDDPETFFVWQIAVDDAYRGRGIALGLLNAIIERHPGRFQWLKTTIGRTNPASVALFTAFADQRHSILSRTDMFAASEFPDSHEPEDLYVIGPLTN